MRTLPPNRRIRFSPYHEKEYTASYATSGRSTCKGCMRPIKMGELRLSRLCPAHRYPGDTDVWHHPLCMFTETLQYPLYAKDMEGIDKLDPKDQSRIAAIFKEYGAEKDVYSEQHEGLLVDYREMDDLDCAHCKSHIKSTDLKLGMYIRPPKKSVNQSVIIEWHHGACFFKNPDFAEFNVESPLQFAGYKLLEKADQEKLQKFFKEEISSKTVREEISDQESIPSPKKKKKRVLVVHDSN